jgi:hypothetical protein
MIAQSSCRNHALTGNRCSRIIISIMPPTAASGQSIHYESLSGKIPSPANQWQRTLLGHALVIRLIAYAVIILAGLFFATILLPHYTSSTQVGPDRLAPIVFSLAMIVGLSELVWFYTVNRARNRKISQLASFATDNGFAYDPYPILGPHQGVIFNESIQQSAQDFFRGTYSGMNFEIANYSYSLDGSQKETYSYGYLQIALSQPIPHMVLDNLTNNSHVFGQDTDNGIDASFKSQLKQLPLEGDFDTHFKLYCQVGDEQDALYFFTPDLMAMLIDTTANNDVEIVDNSVYVYHKLPLAFTRPEVWQGLFGVIEGLGVQLEGKAVRHSQET